MLTYLYELLVSFITFILGFIGIDLKKKSVSFADEGENKDEVVEEQKEPVNEVSTNNE
jgi:hypothetical protein